MRPTTSIKIAFCIILFLFAPAQAAVELTRGHSALTSSAPAAKTALPEPEFLASEITAAGKILAGYYAGWSGASGYTPAAIDAAKLTHIFYAFADLGSDFRLRLGDPSADLKNFADLKQLKVNHPGLQTLISVGGWTYSRYFSDAASTAANRSVFAQSCLDFILAHGFDGVDIDWEYPVSGGLSTNTSRAADKQNFSLLLRTVREKLDAQSRADGKKYWLTAAGGAGSYYLNKIEPLIAAAEVDFLFVMAYDLHGPWDRYSDFNAPLYNTTAPSPQYKMCVRDAVEPYLAAGVPASKIVLGMPFYGYKYNNVTAAGNGLFSSFTSAVSISYDSIVKTYLSNTNYTDFFDSQARVPYLYGNGTFISYDNARSIAEKVKYAKALGLAGAGIWELSQDRGRVLLESAFGTLYAQLKPIANSGLVVDRETGIVTGFDLKHNTAGQIRAMFEDAQSIAVAGPKGTTVPDTAKVGTGFKITLADEYGDTLDAADAVVFGDANGDGCIDAADAAIIRMLAAGMQQQPGSAAALAADVNGDGIWNAEDAAAVEQAGLFLSEIPQNGR